MLPNARTPALVRTIALSIAILVVAIDSGCGESPTNSSHPVPTVTATPVGAETPAAGAIYLGAYVPPSIGGITVLEQQIGRTFAIDSHYYQWVNLFPALQESADLANGRLAFDSWNCGIPDSQIVAGDADMLITTRALAFKSFGRPIFLRFMWDPNLPAASLSRAACVDSATDGSSGTFSPSEYVAAYKHVHQIFAQQNVTNVIWVWSYDAAGSDPTAYYPGAAYVDWIGVDSYNGGGIAFSTLLGATYSFAAQFGKPILISETGAVPSQQQSYFQSVMPALQQQFPLVQGLVYYDGVNFGENWGLGFAGLSSLATLAGDPYLSAYGAF